MSATFISTKQFSVENNGIVSLRPIAKTASNPKGIMYTKHLANGQTEDVRGIGCVNQHGTVVMLAISKALSNMSDAQICQQFSTLQVGKQSYIDKNGNPATMNYLSRNGVTLDDSQDFAIAW